MGSQEAASIPFQTVLTNQNAVFLGFLAVGGPPVGRASRLKMEFRDSLSGPLIHPSVCLYHDLRLFPDGGLLRRRTIGGLVGNHTGLYVNDKQKESESLFPEVVWKDRTMEIERGYFSLRRS